MGRVQTNVYHARSRSIAIINERLQADPHSHSAPRRGNESADIELGVDRALATIKMPILQPT